MDIIKIAHLKIVIAFILLPKFSFLLEIDTQTGTVITAFLPIPSFPLHVISDYISNKVNCPGWVPGKGEEGQS